MDSFCFSNTYLQSSSWDIIPAFAWTQPKKKHQLYSNSSTFKSQEEKRTKPKRIHGKSDISLKTTCLWDFPSLLSNLCVPVPEKPFHTAWTSYPEKAVKLQPDSCACRGVAGRLPGLHHSFSSWKQSCRRQAWIITEFSIAPMKSDVSPHGIKNSGTITIQSWGTEQLMVEKEMPPYESSFNAS